MNIAFAAECGKTVVFVGILGVGFLGGVAVGFDVFADAVREDVVGR